MASELRKNDQKSTSHPANAHANFRHGISDYNDGSGLSHHLGNDDYRGSNLPDDNELELEDFSGKVAHGNEGLEIIDTEDAR